MTIPEKLKIGVKVYGVEITNKLDLGNVNYSGEISYTDLVIRICPNAQAKMEADFLHEMVHGMLDHLGYTEHDEKKVDELANVLHMVILDNPTVFTPVKEGQHENVCNTESEEMKILNELAGMLEDINPNEIVSHILDGTLLSWLASWKMKSQMLVAFLLENEKARLSEKD